MQAREIDLLDMMGDVLSHWRGLVVALLVGAILMGGFSYMKSYRAAQNAQQQEAVVLEEATVQQQLEQMNNSLDDKSKAAVLAVLNEEKKYDVRKAYFDNSVYMQLDPLQVAQAELVYQIHTADGTRDSQLGAMYASLLNNIGLYEWVAQQTGLEANYVGELISTETVSSLTIQSKTEEQQQEMSLGTNCIKVTIQQADTENCTKLADAVKSYIVEQQKKLNSELGSHTIKLVSETTGIAMDRTLMDEQAKCGNDIADLQTKIANTKADFTEEQTQYYELLTWKPSEQETQIEQNPGAEEISVQTPAVSKKYVFLGAILFVFVYAAVLCLVYIFNTKVRASDELQRLYNIPQIGLVVRESKRKLLLDRWADSLRNYGKRKFSAEQSMELAFAAVKIATVKNGVNNICLMGCNMSAGADQVCESLKAALEKEQINVTVLDNVLYDAEAMEQMNAMQGAVLVEKAGSTLYNEVTSELELLKRQGITVLGGIIVE